MGFRAASLPVTSPYTMLKTELKGMTAGDEFQDERGRTWRLYQMDVVANLNGSTLTLNDVCYLAGGTTPYLAGNSLTNALGGSHNYTRPAGICQATAVPLKDSSGNALSTMVFLLVAGRCTITTGATTATAGDYIIIDTGNVAKATNVAQSDTTTQTIDILNRHIGFAVAASVTTTTDCHIHIPLKVG